MLYLIFSEKRGQIVPESVLKKQKRAEEWALVKKQELTAIRETKVYPDPIRVVSVGRKVKDLLANPENEEWLSISADLCGGIHISNTREAKAFALLSKEGILFSLQSPCKNGTQSTLLRT